MTRIAPRLFARALAGALLLGLAPTLPARAEAPVVAPGTTSFTLANGMTAVVIPDHRVPVVTHMVWYRVGSADEPAGKSGIAHFLEHLMFKGTKEHPDGEFSAILAELGGEENAFTTDDYTAYYQRVAREHLPRVMKLEADRMANLVLTDPVILPERDVVLEERRSRVENDPAAKLGEAMDAALYLNHPYRIPIIGWEREIAALDRSDAITYYDRFYTPNNAVLVVAGDVTTDEVKKLAEETYGKLPRRAEPGVRARPQEPDPIAARRVWLADDRVNQPSLQRSYLVPPYSRAAPGEAEALELLAQIFGGGSTSRLYRALVVEEGISAGAGAWYQGSSYDTTRLGLYAVPRDGVSLEALEAALDRQVARLVEDGVTDEELARAKRTVIADSLYAQDSQFALARLFGVALTTGSSIDAVQHWPARIEAVTTADIAAAAKKYLDIRRSATGLLEGVAAAAEPAATGAEPAGKRS
ncbi:MAG: pitrilysin family protein [Hyphomicrobiales bacterium]